MRTLRTLGIAVILLLMTLAMSGWKASDVRAPAQNTGVCNELVESATQGLKGALEQAKKQLKGFKDFTVEEIASTCSVPHKGVVVHDVMFKIENTISPVPFFTIPLKKPVTICIHMNVFSHVRLEKPNAELILDKAEALVTKVSVCK